MKNIKKTIGYLTGTALLTIAAVSISFKSAPHSNLEKKAILRKKSILPQAPLPCGFTNYGVVTYVTSPTNFIKPSPGDVEPLLSNIPSPTSPPYYHAPSSIQSANGVNKLYMQNDGNLCLYHGTTVLWMTGAYAGAHYVFFQEDGNLLVTNGPPNANTTTIYWASNVHSTCADSQYIRLLFQNDGNLVYVYPYDLTNYNASSAQWYQVAFTGSGNESVSTHFGQIY